MTITNFINDVWRPCQDRPVKVVVCAIPSCVLSTCKGRKTRSNRPRSASSFANEYERTAPIRISIGLLCPMDFMKEKAIAGAAPETACPYQSLSFSLSEDRTGGEQARAFCQARIALGKEQRDSPAAFLRKICLLSKSSKLLTAGLFQSSVALV